MRAKRALQTCDKGNPSYKRGLVGGVSLLLVLLSVQVNAQKIIIIQDIGIHDKSFRPVVLIELDKGVKSCLQYRDSIYINYINAGPYNISKLALEGHCVSKSNADSLCSYFQGHNRDSLSEKSIRIRIFECNTQKLHTMLNKNESIMLLNRCISQLQSKQISEYLNEWLSYLKL